MATLAELQERLEQLRLNRAQGTREVEYGSGARVAYKSDEEQAAAIADLEQQIRQASGVSMAHTVRVAASKGLDTL